VTIGEALRAGAYWRLAPRERGGLNRVLRDRASARLVVEGIGDALVAAVGEDELARLEQWLLATPRPLTRVPLGNEVVKRVLSFARGAIRAMQRGLGVSALGARARKRPTKARGRRPLRLRVTADTLVTLLGGTAPARVRLVMALAAVAGLWESEILSLRVRDVHLQYLYVNYDNGHGVVRGDFPRWVVPLFEEAFPAPAKIPPETLIFPRRGADRERSSMYREVALAMRAAGVEGLSLADLRRLFQEVALSRGLPTSVVRGTWTHSGPGPAAGRTRSIFEDLHELASYWREPSTVPA
jgi:integrase